jgi:hypothetical protein
LWRIYKHGKAGSFTNEIGVNLKEHEVAFINNQGNIPMNLKTELDLEDLKFSRHKLDFTESHVIGRFLSVWKTAKPKRWIFNDNNVFEIKTKQWQFQSKRFVVVRQQF